MGDNGGSPSALGGETTKASQKILPIQNLCASCREIDLAKLLHVSQQHSYPRPPGGSCGIPSSFPHVIVRYASLSFQEPRSINSNCELCTFVFSQVARQQHADFNLNGSVEMALSLPPVTRYHFYFQDTSKYGFLRNEDEFKYEFRHNENIGKVPETVQSVSTLETFEGKPVTINIACQAESHLSKKIPRRLVHERRTTGSFLQMRNWLRECDETHPGCKIGIDREKLPDNPYLPTRVIDVGDVDSDQVQLYIPQPNSPGRYATLSHRWGGNSYFALTKTTVYALQSGIPCSDLPPTFQDAITVTRQLGLRYLWIDTFCIIQDDGEDWDIESARMGDIYERAYINIAATGAVDGTGGFLSCGIRNQSSFSLPCQECGEVGCITFTDQPDSSFYKNVIKTHINERGWVFQERLLSRRTLHFAKDQIYWECGHQIVSEDGHTHNNYDDAPETDPQPREENSFRNLTLKHYNLDDTKIVLKKHFDFECIGPSLQAPLSSANVMDIDGVEEEWRRYVAWMEILRNYTACHLSFTKDKLPAVQGLASKMSNLIKAKYNYAAGHFIDAPVSLLFTVQSPGGRPKEARCSSWSCLSVDAPILFYDCQSATSCIQLDIEQTFSLPTKKDFVSLVLTGSMRSVKRGPPNGEGSGPARHYSMHYFSETPYGKFQKTLGPVVFDDPADTPAEFWLVPFCKVTPRQRTGNQVMAENCLVLALVKTGGEIGRYLEFRRVGIGHVYISGVFGDGESVTFALS